MLPGFLPQSAAQAPPSALAGDVPAAANADTTGVAGKAFTDALESACDATSPPETASSQKSHVGTSPGLAAWLLALGLGAEAPADAEMTHVSSQPGGEVDVTLPVSTDDDESNDAAAVGEAGNTGTGPLMVVPVIEVIPAMPTPAVVMTANPEERTGEVVTDSATGGGTPASATDHAIDSRPGTDASLGQQISDASMDRPDDVAGRLEQSRTRNAADSTQQDAAALPAEGVGDRSEAMAADFAPAVASADAGRQEVSVTSAGPSTVDGRKAAGPRPEASTPAGSTSTSAVQQEAAPASAARAELAAAALPEGSRGASADAAVSAPANSDEVDAAQKPADIRSEGVQGMSNDAVSSTASTGGRGSHDSRRQNDADARGRHAGLDVAVARTAATAMLTLVASPDGTLRLTPAAQVAPMLIPMLPQDEMVNTERMIQTMRVMVKDQVSEATIHLRPEHFGDVSIEVRVDGKSVSAIIHAESSSVREWLQGQEGSLRNGLSEQGLHLDRLMVQRDGRQDRREAQQQQSERRRQRPRANAHEHQTFEITV